MKIRIIFRGSTIQYIANKNGRPIKLVCLVDAEGQQFDFINNPFCGYSRDFNKTTIS